MALYHDLRHCMLIILMCELQILLFTFYNPKQMAVGSAKNYEIIITMLLNAECFKYVHRTIILLSKILFDIYSVWNGSLRWYFANKMIRKNTFDVLNLFYTSLRP